MSNFTLTDLRGSLPRPSVLIGWLVFLGVLVWSYSPILFELGRTWWTEPDYGHAFAVPLFALVLLLVRRQMIARVPEDEEEPWWSEWSSNWSVVGASVGVVVGLVLFAVLFTVQHAAIAVPEVAAAQEDLAASRVQVGGRLPEARLPDMAGKSQPLAEHYGEQLTVVCFWKSGESPEDGSVTLGPLHGLRMEFSQAQLEKGIHVVGINVGDDLKAVQRGIFSSGLTFPKQFINLHDADGAIFSQVATQGLPRLYVLDAEGKILWFDVGFSKTIRENLKKAVEAGTSLTWLHTATWFYLLLAGAYAGLMGGLVFQVAELFLRRGWADPLPVRGNMWGLAVLALWAVMRLGSTYFAVKTTDKLSLVVGLIGFTLFLGGWRALRWAWQSLAFLVFMLPLPGFIAGWFSQFLQGVCTRISVYIVQTLGIAAVAQGHVIQLEDKPLNVAEACSGLRMLMLFFAVCIGAAFVLRCPLWKKIVIVISAVPIAVLSNVARITLTAFLHVMVSAEVAEKVFHDVAGLLMMPLAMLMLWALMGLLGKLFLEPAPERPLSLGGSLVGMGQNPGHRPTANRRGKK